VSDQPVITMDWTATFLELAGTKAPAGYPSDGVSDLFWRMRGQRALRRGDLEYRRLSTGGDQLFDLSKDVREEANLAAKRPSDPTALRSAWEAINATQLQY
jgi:arylsulfatase A-like enzyme